MFYEVYEIFWNLWKWVEILYNCTCTILQVCTNVVQNLWNLCNWDEILYTHESIADVRACEVQDLKNVSRNSCYQESNIDILFKLLNATVYVKYGLTKSWWTNITP